LLTGLPAESFGRGVKHPPKGSRDYSVFVKGVDTTVEVCQLAQQLQNEEICITDIRRLTRRNTGKPTHVVKIKCTKDSVNQLLLLKL